MWPGDGLYQRVGFIRALDQQPKIANEVLRGDGGRRGGGQLMCQFYQMG
jgi:hypothetical protein